MNGAHAPSSDLVGRQPEMRLLAEALRRRQSRLIWGPADAGKSFMLAKLLAALPSDCRQRCLCWSGPASRRQVVEYLINGLATASDSLVLSKVRGDGFRGAAVSRWVAEQSAARLRGILLSALQQTRYWIFLDHLPAVSAALGKLIKEIIHRTKTPVCLLSRGCSPAETGHAWSVYWTDEYRIRLGPLTEDAGGRLIEMCIRSFGLGSLDGDGFREELLELSEGLPGAIVKMCQMAADPRYHYGDHVKVQLLHVDYLLQTHHLAPSTAPCHEPDAPR